MPQFSAWICLSLKIAGVPEQTAFSPLDASTGDTSSAVFLWRGKGSRVESREVGIGDFFSGETLDRAMDSGFFSSFFPSITRSLGAGFRNFPPQAFSRPSSALVKSPPLRNGVRKRTNPFSAITKGGGVTSIVNEEEDRQQNRCFFFFFF